MRFRILLTSVVMLAASGFASAAPIVPGCAEPGGTEWRTYGGPSSPGVGEFANSRNQWGETTLNPSNVANTKKLWAFRVGANQGTGSFSNTPVVADGCVFVATNTGWVMAINAETGQHVWRQKFSGSSYTLVGGVIVGSPLVANGRVYVGVSRGPSKLDDPGPYVAIMDEQTGAVQTTTDVSNWPHAFINSSPTLLDRPAPLNDLLFQPFAGWENADEPRGGYAILDAITGELIHREWTIPDADYARGYRGVSIWCSPAVDQVTGFAYACGGNPASKKLEHPHANALLKIDLRQTIATPLGTAPNPDFGKIVDSFKGNSDQYYPGLDRQPVCEMFGEETRVAAWSAGCVQLDLDFGASPNLWVGGDGRRYVGALQKSGIYYVVRADTMANVTEGGSAGTAMIGAPCLACNFASGAYDDKRIYAAANPPGHIVALSRSNLRYEWAQPIGDGLHYQSVTVANGVVYSMDSGGNLNAFDANAMGTPVLKRPLSPDTGTIVTDGGGSTGIAIARSTIYTVAGEWVVAYR